MTFKTTNKGNLQKSKTHTHLGVKIKFYHLLFYQSTTSFEKLNLWLL